MIINQDKTLIGWNEWCELPKLKLPAVKVKIDTGAKISALHAFDISQHKIKGKDIVKFFIHPLQANVEVIRKCSAEIIDQRNITSSNGHKENRYIIKTPIIMGDYEWEIEVSLSNRDPLAYRMLLGRDAMEHFIIEPHKNLLLGKISKKSLKELYKDD